jgi:hypothetical protein
VHIKESFPEEDASCEAGGVLNFKGQSVKGNNFHVRSDNNFWRNQASSTVYDGV